MVLGVCDGVFMVWLVVMLVYVMLLLENVMVYVLLLEWMKLVVFVVIFFFFLVLLEFLLVLWDFCIMLLLVVVLMVWLWFVSCCWINLMCVLLFLRRKMLWCVISLVIILVWFMLVCIMNWVVLRWGCVGVVLSWLGVIVSRMVCFMMNVVRWWWCWRWMNCCVWKLFIVRCWLMVCWMWRWLMVYVCVRLNCIV